MERRTFLKLNGHALLYSALLGNATLSMAADGIPEIVSADVKSWRGFNLYELYYDKFQGPIQELDFQFMAEFGFNVARIPLNYWQWSDRDNWNKIDERYFQQQLDPVIKWGKQYGIHICLCMYRAPGYCINRRNLEKYDLFTSSPANRADALDAFAKHWKYISDRYKNIPRSDLSFNLLNEPPTFYNPQMYLDVVDTLIDAIRPSSPDRLIIIDGLNTSTVPLNTFSYRKNLVQSIHAYMPGVITHAASAPANAKTMVQKWPATDKTGNWNKNRLINTYKPWVAQGKRSFPVFVGEWGVINNTPHDTTLAYMKDQLELFRQNRWGWALWNLRGAFGVMDSNRKDVSYENYKGHKLDRKMLDLLKSYI